MANRFFSPVPQFFDASGNSLSGGKLFFYVTGTSTPAATYTDPKLTTPNTNPIVLDISGGVPDDIFLDPAVTYKIILQDANGNVVWTRDPIVDPAANVSAALRIYNANPNGNVAGTAGTVGGSGASVVFDIANNLLWVCTTTGNATTAIWTQIGATLSGAVIMSSVISPSALGGNQNDYGPPGFSTASHVRQDCSADVVITGLAAGTKGRIVVWTNTSQTNSQTFKDESSSSVAGNRFAGAGDYVLEPKSSVWFWYDDITARWRVVGGGSTIAAVNTEPGGRLTISSNEPIITSDVTARTTVFYTPFRHNYAKLYNGGGWYAVQFSELSQTLADNTKSPAPALPNAVYDMFLWNDNGTLRCTRGPAWSTQTARGTGVGSTELERVDGVLVNKFAVTNGPQAQRGLYVGTIATNAATQMSVMLYPAAVDGGPNNRIDIWNYYNRVDVASTARDSTNQWTYTASTWRSSNNNANNRITIVSGINEDVVSVTAVGAAYNSNGALVRAGVGIDSTSAPFGMTGSAQAGWIDTFSAFYSGLVGIGVHFFQWLEWSTASGTTTWYGDNNTAENFTGIQYVGRY